MRFPFMFVVLSLFSSLISASCDIVKDTNDLNDDIANNLNNSTYFTYSHYRNETDNELNKLPPYHAFNAAQFAADGRRCALKGEYEKSIDYFRQAAFAGSLFAALFLTDVYCKGELHAEINEELMDFYKVTNLRLILKTCTNHLCANENNTFEPSNCKACLNKSRKFINPNAEIIQINNCKVGFDREEYWQIIFFKKLILLENLKRKTPWAIKILILHDTNVKKLFDHHYVSVSKIRHDVNEVINTHDWYLHLLISLDCIFSINQDNSNRKQTQAFELLDEGINNLQNLDIDQQVKNDTLLRLYHYYMMRIDYYNNAYNFKISNHILNLLQNHDYTPSKFEHVKNYLNKYTYLFYNETFLTSMLKYLQNEKILISSYHPKNVVLQFIESIFNKEYYSMSQANLFSNLIIQSFDHENLLLDDIIIKALETLTSNTLIRSLLNNLKRNPRANTNLSNRIIEKLQARIDGQKT